MNKQENGNELSEEQQKAPVKKNYTEPELKKLGNVEQLTQGEIGPLPDVGALGSL